MGEFKGDFAPHAEKWVFISRLDKANYPKKLSFKISA